MAVGAAKASMLMGHFTGVEAASLYNTDLEIAAETIGGAGNFSVAAMLQTDGVGSIGIAGTATAILK
jgi:hypothetical protein